MFTSHTVRVGLIAALAAMACREKGNPGAPPAAGATRSPGSAAAAPATRAPTAAPTPIPTPEPPERYVATRRGGRPLVRNSRFPSNEVPFSRLDRVEEVDLDLDGNTEALVEGIGSVREIPPGIPNVGVLSMRRLPFESPLLAVFTRNGAEWRPLYVAHVPLACPQSGDFARCDQIVDFRTVRFRYDDRPQVLVRIQRRGDAGQLEVGTYRMIDGKLETTFSASMSRTGLEVDVDPFGIHRRLAVDTFVNRQLSPAYRSFTLVSNFIFGERRFRVYTETAEEPFSESGDVELSFWGLVHQQNFREELQRFRTRARQPGDADPVKVVQARYREARNVRSSTKRDGLAVVHFELPGCSAHAVLYQPLRESAGPGSAWDLANLRTGKPQAHECLDEPPVALR